MNSIYLCYFWRFFTKKLPLLTQKNNLYFFFFLWRIFKLIFCLNPTARAAKEDRRIINKYVERNFGNGIQFNVAEWNHIHIHLYVYIIKNVMIASLSRTPRLIFIIVALAMKKKHKHLRGQRLVRSWWLKCAAAGQRLQPESYVTSYSLVLWLMMLMFGRRVYVLVRCGTLYLLCL